MSESRRRGRKVQSEAKSSSSMRIFYIVIAAVAIGGVALLATFLMGQNGDTTANSDAPLPAESFDYPTGRTEQGFYYKGNPEAPVTVVEYADFQCPACGNFTNSAFYRQLTSDYIATGQVQYVFHDFPLEYHQNARGASEAAYCAGEMGQYWQMHELIFRNQSEWSGLAQAQFDPYIVNQAAALGLNEQEFQSCLASNKYEAHVAGTYQAAVNAGIPATPTFVVDGQQVNASELQVAIDQALAQKGGS